MLVEMGSSRRLLLAGMLLSAACVSGQERVVSEERPGDLPAATTSAASAPTDSTSTSTSMSTSTSTTSTTTTTLAPLQGLRLEWVGTDLARPTFLAAPRGDPRLFVVEQQGRVVVLRADGEIEPFLDIREEVGAIGIEQGLLGLAFHPAFRDNGRFYLYYTDRAEDSRLIEYVVGPDPDRADPARRREVLFVDQPADRHNAGMLAFGPDGYLYVALGDGGDGGGHGQEIDSLLGKILRLDVDRGDPYSIPADNPFVAGAGAPEIWAYGLRNPWRFSIDEVEGLLYVADVGQSDLEEIDVVELRPVGYDFGWANMEGSECFAGRQCDPTGTVLPTVEYGHDQGCSVTGGYVYRGAAIPEIRGHYFYGDWCGGWVRSFRYEQGTATEQVDWSEDLGEIGQITSFGVDGQGELYITTWHGGIARIVAER